MQSERIAEEIVLDFETRSAVDLKKVGPWVYSEHYSTEIICLCWEVNDVPFEWRPGDPIPWRTLIYHLHEGTLFVAHNAMFERAIWQNILVDLYDWPPVPHEQWDCTQAACAMKALPLRLEFANKALALPEQKDMEGAAALKKATKPRKPTKADPHSVWCEGPEITGRIVNYCHQDVKAQKNLRRRLGRMPGDERAVYLLDQKMNERGIKMDVEAIKAGIKVVDEIAGGVDAEFREITGYGVGQRDRILDWLAANGCPMPDTQGETIDTYLANSAGFDPHVVRALTLKRMASRASNHKLPAMLRQTCQDGRSRGTMQYHGATTGRNTGRLWQPLNLPRPSGPFEDYGEREICAFMEVLKLQDTPFLEAIYGDALEAISNMLRGFLTVGRGCKMVAGDWAGIEARILAALGGETWKIEAFRAADRGEGRDSYCIAADKVFGYRVEGKKTHPRERQVGKTCLDGHTAVVTSNGIKELHSVTRDDLLWDGQGWVAHDGLQCKGHRETIGVNGVWLTPDHEVLTASGWREALTVACCQNTLQSAKAIGMDALLRLKTSAEPGKSWCSVSAEQSQGASTYPTYVKGEQRNATSAPSSHRHVGGRGIGHTPTCAPTTKLAAAYSTGCLPPKVGVRTQAAPETGTMLAGVSSSASRINEKLWPTLSRSLASMTQSWKWIASIVTGTTSRATFGLSVEATTCRTSGRSGSFNNASLNSKKRTLVYDVINAGPRKRFTVLAEDGTALVVSNCELAFGYQGGVGAWRNFDSSDRYTDEEVDAFKQAWRDGHPGICDKENGLWYKYERAAVATVYRKQPHSVGPIEFALEDEWLTIRLPSGRKLWYFQPTVRIALTPWDTEQLKLSYMQQRDGQWKRVDTYGGKITENIVQAISRDILVPATFEAERYRHPVILTIYDEIVTEPLERDADPELLRQIMCDVDPWVKELNIPIAADPWIGTRFRK